MDVVFTVGRVERGVHLFNIHSAVRVGRMAGGTGPLGRVGVGRVAIQATQALMNPGRGPVIARSGLAEGVRRMALGAESLARVIRDVHRMPITHHRRDG